MISGCYISGKHTHCTLHAGAYAGVPLRFETEFGQHVAFGSLCVASNSEQPPLTKAQQMSLARLADWVVADIVHSARSRRQRERRRMMELLAIAQKQIDTADDFEKIVCDMLREVYPGAEIGIHTSIDEQLVFEGGTEVAANVIEHGLWEDGEYFDYLIEQFNHLDPVAPRVVRIVAAQCASQSIPTYLVIGSKDFRVVFDDVDSSFVHMAAQMICRGWQNLALREAVNAKNNFLRGITHQLRTPIHGILGSVELLAEELGAREMAIDSTDSRRGSITSNISGDHKDPITYIKTIRSSARELISTVNSLINLNRWTDIAQAERIVALHHINEIETVLLNEVLQASPEQFGYRPSLMFKHHFPPDFDTLTLDIRLFVDCLLPLIVNAIQAAEGGIVSVTITVTNDQQSLFVDIEDTGRGISVADQMNIFKAYEKVDPHTTGAGLGLTLASRLATIMNGEVALARSEIGNGSHFRATFAQPKCSASKRSSDPEPPTPARPSFTFDTPASPGSASLSNYFAQYLIHRGHIQSSIPGGSISIFDYATNAQHQQLEKAAICLIPDSDSCLVINDGQKVWRENNIVYVRGPFLSGILESALDQAQIICFELEHLKKTTDMKVAIDEIMIPPLAEAVAEVPLTVDIPPNLTVAEPVTTEVLTVSLQTLHIKDPTPSSTRLCPKPTTLIVDDNAVNLRFLEMYCRRRAIPCLTAIDGFKAVTAFSEHQAAAFSQLHNGSYSDASTKQPHPIELVLMDLQMPNCDGLEATKRIRELEKENNWRKSIVIIVTGQDSLKDRLDSREAGADGFFVKPVGPKVLDKGIKEWFPAAKI